MQLTCAFQAVFLFILLVLYVFLLLCHLSYLTVKISEFEKINLFCVFRVFANCSKYVNLTLQKTNCKFDSCSNPNASCAAVEQAAEECRNAGFCVDWRKLTNGTCGMWYFL